MRVLIVHNSYRSPGGEDAVVNAESEELLRRGHVIRLLTASNTGIAEERSLSLTFALAVNSIWSRSMRSQIAFAIRKLGAEVVHFHNTFPLISPAGYSVCSSNGAAVVQTLHNYRLVCPSATLYRDERVCEDCLSRTFPYPGIWHACYRGSRAQSGMTAAMLTVHRLRRTWTHDVDRFIALTDFAKQKYVAGGLPAELLAVKPNYVEVDATPDHVSRDGFIFVGRLASEKGIGTLLTSWKRSGTPTLKIAGDGPLHDSVYEVSSPSIRYLGRLDRGAVIALMRSSRALIFPSEWYEGFPVTIAEAFACGTPVIASRLGAMAEIVEDGVTGLLFEPRNADDLAAKVRWAHEHPAEMRQMGDNARREYEAKYTPERNYEMLMDIYEQAIEHAKQRRR